MKIFCTKRGEIIFSTNEKKDKKVKRTIKRCEIVHEMTLCGKWALREEATWSPTLDTRFLTGLLSIL